MESAKAQQRELLRLRSLSVALNQRCCLRRNERRMTAPTSESSPANPIAGRWLAVWGRLVRLPPVPVDTGGAAAAGVGVACGGACGAGRAAATGGGVDGGAAAARGGTTGTTLSDSTSNSRRSSGSLLVSLSSLPR